jgi:hypothetical protein
LSFLARWRLLAGVTLLQVLAATAVRIAPLQKVRALASRAARGVFGTPPNAYDDRQVVWAIEATGRRLPAISSCLVQALVGEAILGTAARPVRLAIGVKRRSDGSLDAHAWVATADGIVIGATPDQYTQLVEWESPST